MGYDNSPGKDVGNVRLYDRIGGHASPNKMAFRAMAGSFESFFGFSNHPPPESTRTWPLDLFDAIFDPLRPDGAPSSLRRRPMRCPRRFGQ